MKNPILSLSPQFHFSAHPWASLALSLALLFPSFVSARVFEVKPDSHIDVVYLTAKDCIYCKSWRYMGAGDWARFSETKTAQSVNLVTVEKGTLRNEIKRDDYAPEHRNLYDAAPKFGNTLPAWWVLLDGKPVMRALGENRWKEKIEPVLENLVRTKLKGGGPMEYAASVPPKPTSVPSNVEDVENVPYLSGSGKDSYRRWLNARLPRAFALSPDGVFYWWGGGGTPVQKALDGCNANAVDRPCVIYASDREVIFKID